MDKPEHRTRAPYLQIHYLGFENVPESFDAFRVVQIDAVPEPASGMLMLIGGVLMFVRRGRRTV